MNPLHRRLAALRRRLRLVIVWRGVAGMLIVLLGCGMLAGWLDWAFRLPGLVRALLLVSTIAGVGIVALRYFLQPLLARSDDLALALRVEEQYPVFNDALASTVQFLNQGSSAVAGTSASMRLEAVKRAMRLAEGCDFNAIVDRQGVYKLGGSALSIIALTVFAFFFFPGLAWTAFLRLVEPFGNHSWTRLELDRGSRQKRVALGKPFVVRGRVTGVIPTQAFLEVESQEDDLVRNEKRTMPIQVNEETGAAEFDTALDMTQQKGRFRFRVWANDAVYPGPNIWHEVEVVSPPRLAMLNGKPSPQIELYFPAYTDLPTPQKLWPGSQHIHAVSGTLVVLRAAVDRPIHKAWIEYRPENPFAKTAALLGPWGTAELLHFLALTVGGAAVHGQIPAHIEGDGVSFVVTFMPWVAGSYILHLEDDEGMAREYEWTLQVMQDPPPVVNLEQPATSQSMLPGAEITLKVTARDERYAVRTLALEYRRKDAEGNWLDPAPRRLPLFDAKLAEAQAQQAQRIANPVLLPNDSIRLRPKNVNIDRRLPLSELERSLAIGQSIVLQAVADDFNNVAAFPNPGRSQEVELKIVGKPKLDRIVDDGLSQVQEELVRLQKMQNEALETVKNIQENKDKPGFPINQKIAEVEQSQKQIQARIGSNREEGLRAEVSKLKQMLRDNKLPPSDIQDRIKTLEAELDRLSKEDIPQIEPNLVEARKRLNDGSRQKDAKKQDPLEKAHQHQRNAKRALDELVQFMNPWAGMHQIKGVARALQEKQDDLKKATIKLQAQFPKEQGSEAAQKELDRVTAAQNDLAENMENLLNMMEKAQKKRQAEGDKNSARQLKEAIDKAARGFIPEKMRQAKKLLQEPEPQFNQAIDQQKQSLQELDKMIAALEERRDDQVEQLLQKQRKEEGHLEEFRERQDILRKKTKAAREELDKLTKKKRDVEEMLQKKEGDPQKLKAEQEQLQKKIQEQKKALERLADEQRKLKDEVKDKARELARLQADQASKELNQAGQEMDRAVQDLDAGEDPDEAQQQALDRLDEAHLKLQDAQDQLAREQLAKITDRIKGLKMRQEAARAAETRVHTLIVEKRKKWDSDSLKTIKNQTTAQKVLARETDRLKEKLKGAKVFAHILERSVQAMDEAADRLEKRRDKGNLRQLEAMEKEEIADEIRAHHEIQFFQQDAGRRLDRLLEALKNEPVQARRPPKKQAKKDGAGEDKKDEEGGLRGPGDGIPPIAQLKALRDEQKEVNVRTKDFHKRFPKWPTVNEDQKARLPELQAEITQIQADQAAIQRLFEEISSQAADKKGDVP
jgi:hypothetical protein